MNQQIAPQSAAALIEQVVIGGDLAKLTPQQRVVYYRNVCDSLGLNPLTRPFQYLTLNGKLVLYAARDCTDQLRSIRGVSVKLVETKSMEGVIMVRAMATDKTGRTDESTGAVSIVGLKGESLCNAVMKAETKAKRRVTLSICGLGLMDETEVETVRDARPEHVDAATGEIAPPRPARQPAKPMTREQAAAAGHEDLDRKFRETVDDQGEIHNTSAPSGAGNGGLTSPTVASSPPAEATQAPAQAEGAQAPLTHMKGAGLSGSGPEGVTSEPYDAAREYDALLDGAMAEKTKGARTQYWAMQREEGAAGFVLYERAPDLYKELSAKIMRSIKELAA